MSYTAMTPCNQQSQDGNRNGKQGNNSASFQRVRGLLIAPAQWWELLLASYWGTAKTWTFLATNSCTQSLGVFICYWCNCMEVTNIISSDKWLIEEKTKIMKPHNQISDIYKLFFLLPSSPQMSPLVVCKGTAVIYWDRSSFINTARFIIF